MQSLDHLIGEGGVRQRHACPRLDAVLQKVVDETLAIRFCLDVCNKDNRINRDPHAAA